MREVFLNCNQVSSMSGCSSCAVPKSDCIIYDNDGKKKPIKLYAVKIMENYLF